MADDDDRPATRWAKLLYPAIDGAIERHLPLTPIVVSTGAMLNSAAA
jgi:hypothetical protein